jgi:hypothetical protein
MVQTKILFPTLKLFAAELCVVGESTVAPPAITLHDPLPTAAIFALSV